MADDLIEYWLPRTCLVVKGELTTKNDEVFTGAARDAHAVKSTHAELSLDTEADRTRAVPYVVKVHRGPLFDTSVSVELTEDRRLVSASTETSGQAGKIVLGAVGVAAAGASLVAGFAPGVLGGTSLLAGATRGVMEAAPDDDSAVEEAILSAAAKVSKDAVVVAKAFLKENKEVALARKRFSDLALGLLDDLREALGAVELAQGDDDAHKKAVARVVTCQKALEVARAEVTRLNAIFDAWRAGKIKEATETVERRIPLQKVIEAATAPANAVDGDLKCVREILLKLGTWVVAEGGDALANGDYTLEAVTTRCLEPPARSTGEGVLLRQPRRTTLAIYQYYKNDKPAPYAGKPYPPTISAGANFRLVERRTCFVVDSNCRHEFVPFRRSLWAKKTTALTLSQLGGLKTYTATATSQAAAIAETAGAVPSTVSSALADATKIRGEFDALKDRSLDLQIAEIKKQIDLKTQELTLAGLNATSAQFAELERLKQQQAILEAQAAIRKSQAEVIA
jgi:hypothetical protein